MSPRHLFCSISIKIPFCGHFSWGVTSEDLCYQLCVLPGVCQAGKFTFLKPTGQAGELSALSAVAARN